MSRSFRRRMCWKTKLASGWWLRKTAGAVDRTWTQTPRGSSAPLSWPVVVLSRIWLWKQAGRGVGQYVILGAGLDTFAQRRPEIASRLRIFEVDQPGPQVWKRQRLIELGFGIPEWLPAARLKARLRSRAWAPGGDPPTWRLDPVGSPAGTMRYSGAVAVPSTAPP